MSNLTDEDYKRIAAELLAHGLDITSIPATTETEGIISLPAVRNGELVNVDLTKLLSVISAATTEARNATSAALKAKTDAAEAAAAANDAATGAANVISEHSVTALRALLGATAFFDEIIEDVTIQPANPTNEEGGHVVYVRAKKQFAFKILQGAVTRYYANWSKETLYHEYDSYAIAKNKIYVNANELFVWDEQLQDIKKVSTEAVVQLVQEISDDATKAPSSAAVKNAITAINQKITNKVSKDELNTINGQTLLGGHDIKIEGGGGDNSLTKNLIITNNKLLGKVFFGKGISATGVTVDSKDVVSTDFIEIKKGHNLLLTSSAGTVKCAYYDESKKFLDFFSKSGSISEVLTPPQGAIYLRANLDRAKYMQRIDNIEDTEEDAEYACLGLNDIIRLEPVRNEVGYIMSDGTTKNVQNIKATSVYDVTDITEIFVKVEEVKLNVGCAFIWCKDANGKITETIAREKAVESFNYTKLVLPPGTNEVWAFVTLQLYAEQSGKNVYDKIRNCVKKEKEIEEDVTQITDRVNALENATPSTPTPTPQPTTNSLNHWKGKKIVWLGSSVPAGQTSETDPEVVKPGTNFLKRPYPTQIAEMLECTVINNCKSGMAVVANKVTDGVYHPLKYGSFCLTKAEYKAANLNREGKYTYEDSLISADCRNADLYVLEFEINNLGLDEGKTAYESIIPKFEFGNWRYTDGSSFANHRETYQGAILFLLDELYKVNPTAKIVFVNEFFSAAASKWGAEFMPQTLTRKLAEKLNAPYIELSKILQYNAVNRWKYMFSEDDMHVRAAVHDRIANILTHKFLEIA